MYWNHTMSALYRAPVTLRGDPDMPFVITQPCVGVKDTACVDVCPSDCIHPTKDEAGYAAAEMLYIDPGVCIDCGLCASACPVQAIFAEEDVPAEWRHFIERNAEHYRKGT